MQQSGQAGFEKGSIDARLKYILGISAQNESQYAINQKNIAILSGANIIFYDPVKNQQVKYIAHKNYQISSIAVSPDNKFIAVAELTKGSLISIYQLNSNKRVQSIPSLYLKGHRHGVNLLAYSPNGKYLVSVSNEDGGMFVWQDSTRLTQNKMNKRINKILFNQQGDLYTAGIQHLKIWNFNKGQLIRQKLNECWIMEGKGISLGKRFSDKEFVNISTKNNITIALTSDGLLCILNQVSIEKWINLKVESTRALQISGSHIICGGFSSVIKVIDIETLQLVCTLPKPPAVDNQNIQKDSKTVFEEQNQRFPYCVGLKVLGDELIALYANNCMFIWDIRHFQKTKAIRSFLSHQNQILCLELLDQISNQVIFFATSSKDKTIRIWHIYDQCFDSGESIDIAALIGIKRNAYCKNLTRIIYLTEEIIIMKNYDYKLFCFSTHYLFIYSLKSFNLLSTQNLQFYILSVQLKDSMFYIGCSDFHIRVYNIGQSSIKLVKAVWINEKVDSIKCCENSLIILSNQSMKILDTLNLKVLKQQTKVSCFATKSNLYYYVKSDMLYINSIVKFNCKQSFKLQNLNGQDRHPSILKITEYYLVTVVTTEIPNILDIWTTQGTFIYQQFIGQTITDIICLDNNDVVLVGVTGSIVLCTYAMKQKMKKVENNLKKWFEMSDMNWMMDSIWINDNVELPNLKGLNHIALIESVRIPEKKQEQQNQNKRISLPGNISNVNINYKRIDNNKQSIFNPSDIFNQANKILNNVQDIEKKINMKTKDNIFQSKKIDITQKQVAQINVCFVNTAKQQKYPSINSESQSIHVKTSHYDDSTTIQNFKSLICRVEQYGQSDEFINSHSGQLEVIYKFLQKQFSKSKKIQLKKKAAELMSNYKQAMQKLINEI